MSSILIGSIIICLLAMAWSIVLLRRIGDWRVGFLTAMLGFIALRQVLIALALMYSWGLPFTVRQIELHGLVVSILALFSAVFLEIIIHQEVDSRKALGETKAFYERLVGEAGDAMVAVDRDSRIITWNKRAEDLFGFRADEVLGSHARFLVPEEEMERARVIKRVVMGGRTMCNETVRRLVNGDGCIDGLATFSPLRDKSGEIVGVLSVFKDISEKIRKEEELRLNIEGLRDTQKRLIRAEKMASVGQLTAGVSHEVLNPLNIILMRLHLMLQNPDTPLEVVRNLQILEEQANRISKITKDLLSFSRQNPPEQRPVCMNETIMRTLRLLEHDLQLDDIDVELDLEEGLMPVAADQDQIQQVVLNLLTNARDAMPDGGRLVLKTGLVNSGASRSVEVRIEDTGPGIDPQAMDKLFDPFFTTKPDGEGTGLGLSICQGIMETHGGSIWAENVPSGGAAFVLRLAAEDDYGHQDLGG